MLDFTAMKPVSADIASIQGAFHELADTLSAAWESAGALSELSPTQSIQAMNQLLDLLRQLQQPTSEPEGRDISTLAEFGLQLLSELEALAEPLQLPECARGLESLSVPFAAWTARQGAEIRSLHLIVCGLTHLSNHSGHTDSLIVLLDMANEVCDAASPALSDPSSKPAEHYPWRRLLLTRAEVATRTLQPALMEPVFDAVVECIPEDAPHFFGALVEQMTIIGYPDQVRALLTRYFEAIGTPPLLH